MFSRPVLRYRTVVINLQHGAFGIFGRSDVALGFRGKLALFVSEMGADDADFHKGLEHSRGRPFEIVTGNDCRIKKV